MIFAFLVRLPFMMITGVRYDWWWYAHDGSNIAKGHKPFVDFSFYGHNCVPPGYLIVVTSFYILVKSFGFSVDSFFYNFSMKSWMVFGDIACVYLVYHICLSLNLGEEKSKIASIIVAFNPYMAFESAWQGHFDSIVAASLLAGVYFALKGRSFLSGLVLSIGFLIKMIPAIGLILIFKFKRYSEKGKFVLGFFSLIALIYAVFIWWIGSLSFILDPIRYHGSRTDYLNETNKTATYFFFLYITNSFDELAIYVQDVWLFFAVPLLSYLAWRYHKMNDEEEIFKGVFFLTAGLIATMKFINPQYLVWILPFMTIYMVMKPDKLREYSYWFLVFWFIFWAGTLIKFLKPVTGIIFLPALLVFFFPKNLKQVYLKLRTQIIPQKSIGK